jgi:hypothetical protein
MSNNLVDYVRQDEPHDLHHSMFPDMEHTEMQRQWEQLADTIVVDVQCKVKAHLDTCHIPDMHEPLNASLFPPDLHLFLAQRIDEAVPHWNIAQKALAFNVYIHELYNQARHDLFTRIRDKHNRKMDKLVDQSLNNLFNPVKE